jgi:hypothetical protein
MLPATDDRKWTEELHGYGPQFYVLGPLPNDVNVDPLDAELSQATSIDPSVPVSAAGKTFYWRPYEFSWRMGKQGNLGHQGYHGLKRTVTDDFLCLGKEKRGLNETCYVNEIDGAKYYVWTCATVKEASTAEILYSRKPPADKSHTSPVLTPAAVYVNGTLVPESAQSVVLQAGVNPLLVRYDSAGRGHLVLRRKGAPMPVQRTPLAMRWFDDAGVIPFDIWGGERSAEWFRFTTAPGTCAIRVHARGKVESWLDGTPMRAKQDGRFVVARPVARAATVALRVLPEQAGLTGGALIPEPIAVETDGKGVLEPGDWSQIGILNNYSGGVRYRTSLTLNAQEAQSKAALDLGNIAGTAEVLVNGKKAAVLVAPPWKTEVTGLLKKGENRLEVLVYNTLSNHYQTIPSRYRGSPMSGLLGPVTVRYHQVD